MMPLRIALLVLMFAAMLTSRAPAEILLYERTISVNRSVNIFDTNQFDLDLVFGDDQFSPTNGVTLFDALVISPEDAGSTFDATTGSDPEFATVAGRLTDALNEFINVSMTENESGGLTEQRIWQENKFFQQSVPINPPDLVGETLGSLRITIDSFTLITVENEETGAGQPVDLVLTLSFFGAIPEPATCGLLAMGMIVSIMLHRRVVWR